MIQRLTLALALSLCATQTFAQTVPVRSGEHDGFSRLVLDLPQRFDVSSQPRGDGISITFPGRRPEFDISQVFDRLTQGRLESIEAETGKGTLDLSFGCKCAAKTFWHSKSMLVVDIAEVSTLAVNEPDQSGDGQIPRHMLERMLPLATKAVPLSAAMAAAEIGVEQSSSGILDKPNPIKSDFELSPVRLTLLEQMARAANQGLLQPLVAENKTIGPQVESDSGFQGKRLDDTVELNDAKAEPFVPLAQGINLKVQSSIDGAQESGLHADLEADFKEGCLPDQLFEVAGWGQHARFQDQIGELNRALSQEFDTFNLDAVFRMVRLYLYFGFGLEARQLTLLTGSTSEEARVLQELAAVIEQSETLPDAPRLRNDLGCHGTGALWAALAHDAIPESQLLDHSAILQAFAALPEHLQQHLGPGLARKLLEAKHHQTSDMIMRSIRDPNQFASPARDLATAELAIADDNFKAAETALQASVVKNEIHSAEALVLLIEQRVSEERAVSYDNAQLAGAFFQEHRGSFLGQRLGRGYLLALAASGAFTESFSEHRRVVAELSPQIANDTYDDMVRLLVRSAVDFDFLRLILTGTKEWLDAIPADLALEVTQRMVELGFADEALRFLSAAKTDPPAPRYQLLMAEVALVQGQPHRAEAEILDLLGPEADRLRARARTALGDHGAAVNHFNSLKDEAAIQQAAWLAQDWQRLLVSDDPVVQKLAYTLSQATPDDSLGVLARDRKLVEQSSDVRGLLNDLLTQTDDLELP